MAITTRRLRQSLSGRRAGENQVARRPPPHLGRSPPALRRLRHHPPPLWRRAVQIGWPAIPPTPSHLPRWCAAPARYRRPPLTMTGLGARPGRRPPALQPTRRRQTRRRRPVASAGANANSGPPQSIGGPELFYAGRWLPARVFSGTDRVIGNPARKTAKIRAEFGAISANLLDIAAATMIQWYYQR